MERQGRVLEPRTLFKRAILSPGNEELLRMIKQRAEEILASLNDPEQMDISEAELQELDPLWVATVYEAVSPESVSAEAEENSDLFYAHAEEEQEIGAAYRYSLIPGLPNYLADLPGKWLANVVPPVDSDEMQDVLESPSAIGAGPLARDLARYGVAPLTVLDATDAVARLLDRCLRTGRVNSEAPITLSHQGMNEGELLNAEDLADEVSQVADCRERTARVLFDWSIQVAQIKPLLFNGFVAESSGREAVKLYRTGEKQDNLHERWGRSVSLPTTKSATFEEYRATQFGLKR